jgi:hypothetical protein
MDTPEPGSLLPQLPANLDDSAALDRWCREWNAWIATEAVKPNWSWLKPITPDMLREIIDEEKQLRADIARGYQQVELATARSDLNALETHLRATDPQFEAKRVLLVPILRPIFRHIPPANWKPLFEQAYARLQVPTAASSEEQRELEDARKALNTLEDQLKTRDPDYQVKRALLVPVLQPLFKQIPPSKWLASFEEAYAGIRLPAAGTVPSEGDKLMRNAESNPLNFDVITQIEKECSAHWTKEIEESNRVYVENEMDRCILPDLRRNAINETLSERQYRGIVSAAWMMAKDLFYALHHNARTAEQNERPNCFWCHQGWKFQNNPLSFLLLGDRRRGYAIHKDWLVISAANYLKRPEIRTNHFDWLYLDSMICCELEVLAQEVFVRGMGTKINWAAVFARAKRGIDIHQVVSKYVPLLILFRLLGFSVNYLSMPALAYWLRMKGHDIASIWTIGLWAAVVALGWITYPSRRRVRRKGERLLAHLVDLNEMLAARTISPRRLREKLDVATADGMVFDGAVTAIVDRMMTRDPAAFVHLM